MNNTPAENIEKVNDLISKIKQHPMALKVTVSKAGILVIYPNGGFAVDGVRASFGIGKAKALGRVIEIMEKHWMQSYPDPKRFS